MHAISLTCLVLLGQAPPVHNIFTYALLEWGKLSLRGMKIVRSIFDLIQRLSYLLIKELIKVAQDVLT